MKCIGEIQGGAASTNAVIMSSEARTVTGRLICAVQLCDLPFVIIRQLLAIGLFILLAGLCQGCRGRPCVRTLKVDETVVLKKGEHKLAVTLFQVQESLFDRALMISVRNEGNTVYEGRCETLFTLSDRGAASFFEFIVAFVPENTDVSAIRKSEKKRQRVLVLDHRMSHLALNPGEECVLIEHRRSWSKDTTTKCVGKLYTKHP